jgi:hypothetical protein
VEAPREATKQDPAARRLRLDGDDLAVLPDVNRGTVHPRDLARAFGRAAQRATDGAGECVWFRGLPGGSQGHCFRRKNRCATGIIVHGAAIGQRPVDALKVLPTPVEAPHDVRARDRLTALPNARRDPPQRQPRRPEPQVHDLDAIARHGSGRCAARRCGACSRSRRRPSRTGQPLVRPSCSARPAPTRRVL